MIKKLAGALLAAGALFVLAAPAADAAAPEAFTITEYFGTSPGANPFEATGPLCDGGTYEQEVTHAAGSVNASRFNQIVTTTYTCDDTGDTFVAHKHWNTLFDGSGGFTTTGQIKFDGGTGQFAQLSGHGAIDASFNLEASPPLQGIAKISGVVKLG